MGTSSLPCLDRARTEIQEEHKRTEEGVTTTEEEEEEAEVMTKTDTVTKHVKEAEEEAEAEASHNIHRDGLEEQPNEKANCLKGAECKMHSSGTVRLMPKVRENVKLSN